MPKLDQTGPQGTGPMTGRGMGPCNKNKRNMPRCGYGCGYGFYGRNYLTPQEETEDLEEIAKNLEEDLQAVKQRISEMKKQQ